ncbi:hypothetical protein [Aurantimonas sp. 22II-16-19i]|uniref:hypothetical protein n=1 Tax=Aurantimonas sp. 22II-16-19i TaxID=1317114 RepID=UPI0009F7DE8F|nr:hypothetical protein [Aurantimonas sp. 22II-16-19i]ORE93851.1 hypothetical protein ATO4_15711 [Aurantimonas sp. 22II-16-19i]
MANPGTTSGLLPTGDLPESLLGHELVGEQRDVRNFLLDVIALRLLASGPLHDIIEVLKGTTGNPDLVASFTTYMNGLGTRLNQSIPTAAILRAAGDVQPRAELADAAGVVKTFIALLSGGVTTMRVGGISGTSPSRDALLASTAGAVTFPWTPIHPTLAATMALPMVRRRLSERPAYTQDILPLELTDGARYMASSGDRDVPIVARSGTVFIDFSLLAQGRSVVVATAGGIARLDAGRLGATTRTFRGTGTRFATISDSATVRVRRLLTDLLTIEEIEGSGHVSSGTQTPFVAAGEKVYLGLGQSFEQRALDGDGTESFLRQLRAGGNADQWLMVNGAFGSTAILEVNKTSDAAQNWWLNTDNTAGPMWTRAKGIMTALKNEGHPDPTYVALIIGQNEMDGVFAGRCTFADVRDGYLALIGLIRAEYPSAKIIIETMPGRDGNASGQQAQQVVREAQIAVVKSGLAYVIQGGEQYDLERVVGDLHPTEDGQREQMRRRALVVLKDMGASVGLGAVVKSWTRVSATKTRLVISLPHDTPTANEGWRDIAILPNGDPTKDMAVVKPIKCDFVSLVGTDFDRQWEITHADVTTAFAGAGATDGRLVYPYGYCLDADRGGAIGDHGTLNGLPARTSIV